MIETIYAKDPLKAQSLKDPWKIERRNEEVKLQEMWQHKEVLIRSNVRTFKIRDNHFEPGKAEREKRKRTTIKPPKRTYYCNEKHAFDSQYIQILQDVRMNTLQNMKRKLTRWTMVSNLTTLQVKKLGYNLKSFKMYLKESKDKWRVLLIAHQMADFTEIK